MGVARLMRGRADGIMQFASTVPAFVASLVPLLAIALLSAALMVGKAGLEGATGLFLIVLVNQLAPPVLSHLVARRWDREEDWLRYATAFNWCQCALPVVALAMLFGIAVMVSSGVPREAAATLGFGGLLAYTLWLSWFLARVGLDLSRARAVALVVLVLAGTVGLTLLPLVFSEGGEGQQGVASQ